MKLPELRRTLRKLSTEVTRCSGQLAVLAGAQQLPPLTSSQHKLLDDLAAGATLELRIGALGRIGDFLLVRSGRVIGVIPRRTLAAICRVPPVQAGRFPIRPIKKRAKG